MFILVVARCVVRLVSCVCSGRGNLDHRDGSRRQLDTAAGSKRRDDTNVVLFWW
eukprot:COSAG02_NODE_37_length_48203_cov_57.745708_18_plen_54_part_00